MSRNCKVITTCFTGREIREENEFIGDPPGWFGHAQKFPDPESVLKLVKMIRDLEIKVDPGVESDTIIVNNDVGWEEGNRFLESIHDADIFSGKLKVISRENFGRAYGGYNRAFEIFRNDYEYWTFTEDDILVIGDKYFKHCIDTFTKTPKAGFVALQGLSKEIRLHAHGGVGTTHASVLDAVYKKFGKLPHCERHQPQTYDDIIRNGEVAFTNAISKLGYALVNVEARQPLYVFAYDYIRNGDAPRQGSVPVRASPGSSPDQRNPSHSVEFGVEETALVPLSVRTKRFIKRFTPPIVLDLYRALRRKYLWEGIYRNFRDVPHHGNLLDEQSYNTPALRSWVDGEVSYTRQAIEAAARNRVVPTEPAGLDVLLPLLVSLVEAMEGDRLRILDFGGGVGISYVNLRSSLPGNRDIEYHVVDLDWSCAAGPGLFVNDDQIHFHRSLPPDLAGIDIVHMDGVLNIIEDYPGLLKSLSAYGAPYFLICHLYAGEFPTYASNLTSTPGMVIPFWFFNANEIIAIMRRNCYSLICKGAHREFHDQENFPAQCRMDRGRACALLFKRDMPLA